MTQQLENNGFLRIKQILEMIPISRATWWRGVKSGQYPKPIKIGPKITCWRREDIRTLIDRLAGITTRNGGAQ